VFPSQWDPIVSCPAAEFCCETDDSDPSACCNLTNTTSNPIFTLEAATTVTVIGVTSTSTGVLISTVTTVQGSQTAAPSVNGGNNGGGGGISSGAKIGIGVGVGGGVLLIAALLGFVFWWRKRGSGERVVSEMQSQDVRKAELPGSDFRSTKTVTAEAQVGKYIQPEVIYSELDGSNTRPGGLGQ
jgi:hypothetical protein